MASTAVRLESAKPLGRASSCWKATVRSATGTLAAPQRRAKEAVALSIVFKGAKLALCYLCPGMKCVRGNM